MTRRPVRNTPHVPPTAAGAHVETLSPRMQSAVLSCRTSAKHASMRNSELCFSASLIIPFSRLMRRLHALPAEELDNLDAIDPEEHIPICTVSELLRGAIALTGDLDIGLKAARVRGADGAHVDRRRRRSGAT